MGTPSTGRRAALLFIVTLLPFALVIPGFIWLSSETGSRWAYLLPREHALHFGGNPAEVLSHLLDWLFFIGGILGLAWAWWWLPQGKMNSLPVLAPFFFGQLAGLSILFLGGTFIDFRKGEGTFPIACYIFLFPYLLGANLVIHRLRTIPPRRRLPTLLVFLGASFAMQFFCEPSGTGAPNELFLLLAPATLLLCFFFCRCTIPKAPQTA